MSHLSFYDVLLDFVLLDAFDDLETPPYTVATAVQNRWLSARIKETVSTLGPVPESPLIFQAWSQIWTSKSLE